MTIQMTRVSLKGILMRCQARIATASAVRLKVVNALLGERVLFLIRKSHREFFLVLLSELSWYPNSIYLERDIAMIVPSRLTVTY